MKKIFTPTSGVYIGGSSRHLEEDIAYYRKITSVVAQYGHVPTSNWVELAYARNPRGDKNATMDWQKIMEGNLESITQADMVIIEATWYGFAEGFFVMAALQQKKPVLCVMRNVDLADRIASGITDKLFTLKTYNTEEDLEKIADKFLHENTLTSKDLRFNFYIDNDIYNHLRWASFKTGKTKSEIIRELIEKEIDKEEY